MKGGETATVTITFSEKVTGFNASDVTVTGGSIGALSSADGGKTWTGTFTPSANTESTAHVSVANTYTDLAGNANTAVKPGDIADQALAKALDLSNPKAIAASNVHLQSWEKDRSAYDLAWEEVKAA